MSAESTESTEPVATTSGGGDAAMSEAWFVAFLEGLPGLEEEVLEEEGVDEDMNEKVPAELEGLICEEAPPEEEEEAAEGAQAAPRRASP